MQEPENLNSKVIYLMNRRKKIFLKYLFVKNLLDVKTSKQPLPFKKLKRHMLTRTKLVISWVQFAISAAIFWFSDLFTAERTLKDGSREFTQLSRWVELPCIRVVQIIIQNGLAQNVKRILSKLLFCLIAVLFSQHKKREAQKRRKKKVEHRSRLIIDAREKSENLICWSGNMRWKMQIIRRSGMTAV